MPRRRYTSTEKAQLVDEWLSARRLGVRQEVFAANHGISARRLREAVAEYGPVAAPVEEARRVVSTALAGLQQILVQLDAHHQCEGVDEARRPASDASTDPPPPRVLAPDGLGRPLPAPPTTEAPSGAPDGGPPRKTIWDLDAQDEGEDDHE